MTCISIERIIEYCRAYDEIWGDYPESIYEGASLSEWILECDMWFTDREKCIIEAEGQFDWVSGQVFMNGDWRLL